MQYGTRIEEKELKNAAYWADAIADRLIEKYPDRKEFVCAAGISPSGPIHFGNFREIITAYAVADALIRKGKKAELIFSWDNYDRFRKVPKGLDSSYEEYIGTPLSQIPSPDGNLNRTYAETYQKEFETAMESFNIPVTYKNQTELYESGTYTGHIQTAMQKREEIADILLSHMTDKGKELKNIDEKEYRKNYYPIAAYSKFTGKDVTEILSYDGESKIKYRCLITKKEEEIDFTQTHTVKLNWKIDWAMRWKYEDVRFEPAGSDHAAPGGSYDTSAEIAKKIFDTEPPVFTEFGFVGLRGLGTKMSGSAGKTVTPKTLLDIYEPTLLLWMYLRRLPKQTFSLAFDTEVYRQYDELDKALRGHHQDDAEKRVTEILKKTHPDSMYTNPIPFRQLVGLGQIVQWDKEKLQNLLKASGQSFDEESISNRLPKAHTWVTKYNTDAEIKLRTEPNTEYWKTIDEKNKKYIQFLFKFIQENRDDDIKKIDDIKEITDDIKKTEEFLYNLPKVFNISDKTNNTELQEMKKIISFKDSNDFKIVYKKTDNKKLDFYIKDVFKEIYYIKGDKNNFFNFKDSKDFLEEKVQNMDDKEFKKLQWTIFKNINKNYQKDISKEISDMNEEKELKKIQKDLFKHTYKLLIDKDTGPRLATFLHAIPKETILHLLPDDTTK